MLALITCTFLASLVCGEISSINNERKLGKEEWKINVADQDAFTENVLPNAAENQQQESDGFFRKRISYLQSEVNWRRKYNQDLHKELRKLKNSEKIMQNFWKWLEFKTTHGKKYGNYSEERRKFLVFGDNMDYIQRHNDDFNNGRKSYSLKVNKYADMTHEEFKKTMNGYKMRLGDRVARSNNTNFLPPLNFEAPDQVDWRENDYVTPIKDQGHCGSCWAFSATGGLEGQHKRKTGALVSLSEQNLVDCSFKFGNEGCNGGLMDNAFQYIKQNAGVDTEKSYPYEAKEGKCRFKKSSVGADDKGFVDLDQGNETTLMLALASQGPISVAIDAGHKSFQFYHQGIYFEPACSSTELDHGVLAIGYGTIEDGHDYWLIKNSWGTTWGLEGYLQIARNKHNHCGVASQASYPTV